MYFDRALLSILAIGLMFLIAFFLAYWLFRRWLPKRFPVWLRVLASFVVAFGLVSLAMNFYVYTGFGYQGDIYRRGDRNQPWVAITFDDGPHPVWTSAILDILAENEVHATFFMVGAHVDQYPEVAKRIVDEGHSVGNHTYNHVNVPSTSLSNLYTQVLATTVSILDITGQYPEYMRPPRGMYDMRLRRLAELLAQPVVLWSLSGQDWRPGVTPNQITRRVVQQVRGGDILLFHDSGALISREGASRAATVQALPGIIKGIKDQGLKIVPLSQLLAGVAPDSSLPDEQTNELPE